MDTTPASSTPRTTSATPATARALRPLLLLAALTGLLTAGLGLRWLLAPETSPLARMLAPPPLLDLLGPAPVHAAMVVAGLLAAATGAALLTVPTLSPRGSRLITVTGLVEVVVFGLGMASMTTLVGIGYLLALAIPLIVAVTAILLVRGGSPGRRALGAVILLATALAIVLGRALLAQIATELLPALLDRSGELLITFLAVLVGAVWAVLAALALRSTGTLQHLEDWTVRHRRALTLLAACGPLPYALARLTWLTPWPLFGGDIIAGDPAARIWGLLLSTGAWLGVLLTIGLIRPWGEVFPRWFPIVGGRPVPIAAAAVPGFTIAALLTFAAVPVVLSAGQLGLVGMLAFAAIFPCWFWGPTLALAVWGYAGHRRESLEGRAMAPDSARMDA